MFLSCSCFWKNFCLIVLIKLFLYRKSFHFLFKDLPVTGALRRIVALLWRFRLKIICNICRPCLPFYHNLRFSYVRSKDVEQNYRLRNLKSGTSALPFFKVALLEHCEKLERHFGKILFF